MQEYLDTSSGPLHIVDYGGAGPHVVLVHGLAGATVNWNALAPGLTQRAHVVALDLPGFGLTPPWRDYTLDTHVTAVAALVEALDGPVELIGNSTGGLLCEMYASLHPDRVTRMVLIAPATPPVLPDPRIHWPTLARLTVEATPFLGELFIKNLLRGKGPRELLKLSLDTVTEHPGRVPVHVMEDTLDLIQQRKAFPWVEEAISSTATSIARAYLKRSEFRQMVSEIEAPTLLLQGLEDRIVSPTAVEALHRLRPDWDLVQMEGTGHVPQMDAPLRTGRVIEDWLEGALTGAGSTAGSAN